MGLSGCRNVPGPIEEPCEGADCLSGSETLEIPTGLSISNVTENSVAVSWTDPTYLEDYKIKLAYKKSSVDTFTALPLVNKGVGSFSLTGLDMTTTYEIKIKAIESDTNQTEYSSVVTFTTADEEGEIPPPTVFPYPINVSASAAGVIKTIIWNYTNTEYEELDFVHVHRKPAGSNDMSYVSIFTQQINNGVIPVTAFADTTATTGQQVYRVVVEYADGTSAASAQSNAVESTNLASPTNVTVHDNNYYYSGGFIYYDTIEWDSYPGNDHEGFQIRVSYDEGVSYQMMLDDDLIYPTQDNIDLPNETMVRLVPSLCTTSVMYQIRATSSDGPNFHSDWAATDPAWKTCP